MYVHSLGIGRFGFSLNDTNQSNDIYLGYAILAHETLVWKAHKSIFPCHNFSTLVIACNL